MRSWGGNACLSRGGSLGNCQGEVWEAQALRQRGRNPALALRLDTFGGLNKVLHSFTPLQAQATREKTMGFYPLLARRGLNLELTLTI